MERFVLTESSRSACRTRAGTDPGLASDWMTVEYLEACAFPSPRPPTTRNPTTKKTMTPSVSSDDGMAYGALWSSDSSDDESPSPYSNSSSSFSDSDSLPTSFQGLGSSAAAQALQTRSHIRRLSRHRCELEPDVEWVRAQANRDLGIGGEFTEP